jgi:hypothetical protein
MPLASPGWQATGATLGAAEARRGRLGPSHPDARYPRLLGNLIFQEALPKGTRVIAPTSAI